MRWNFCWLKPQKYWSRKSNKKRTLQVLRSSDCRRLSFCLCRARAMKILQITGEVPNRVEKPSPRFPVEGETNDKKMRKRTRPNEEYQMLFRYNGSSTFSEKKRKKCSQSQEDRWKIPPHKNCEYLSWRCSLWGEKRASFLSGYKQQS